jgi:pyridoxamine 5'-phosphate oxidase-like protein
LDALPEWEDGTVAVLCTGGGAPHAIPVSAVVRAGPRRVLVGLAERRASLERLRRDPRCALTLLAGPDIACTVHARAEVLADELVEGVIAVALAVESIQDHMQPRFAIEAGVAWRWTDDEARQRDDVVRAKLSELARR